MIFMFINLLVGIALMGFAFTSEHVSVGQKIEPSMTNHILMLSFVNFMLGVSMLFTYFAPKFLCLLVGRLTFVLMAFFVTSFCKTLLIYKLKGRHTFLTVVQWVLNAAAFVVIFFLGKAITGIEMDENGILRIASANLITGSFGRMIDVTWIDAYVLFFLGALQLLTLLMVLVRAENTRIKIIKQNLLIISLGVVFTWATYALILVGSIYQPALKSLMFVAYVPELIFYVYFCANSTVWGKRLTFRTLLRILVLYIVPAMLVGLGFFIIYKANPEKTSAFYVWCTVLCSVVYGLWVFITSRFVRSDAMRDGKYAEEFEAAITSIDFNDEQSKDVEKPVQEAFKKYVEASFVKIAIDAGTGFLESIGDENEDEKIAVPIDQKGFDVLLNIKHSIVFKSFVEKDYQVKEVREPLLEMMNENKAEAFILLNEGRRIVGAIFLGAKNSGDPYNKYDYEIFKKLYANFFVVGYYMKNMMNESVVGTVNREIRMSSQIITSIQENMDYITNPKVDCGYKMVPAHNIGGEFIDMIRLNDTRHMFIIGALNGKGIAASMSMVILKSVIRTNLAETKDFKLLVEKINSFIRTSLPKGTFFSGMFGIIDFSTDTLYYINCGAPALFMYNHLYNNVIEIQGEGHVLGFAKDISSLIRVKKVKMTAGDIIFVCTDGFIEAKSLRGESYGKTRIQSQIMENASYPAGKMAQFIHENLISFSSRALEDDVTVLIIKQMS